jgi:hypothetical protein
MTMFTTKSTVRVWHKWHPAARLLQVTLAILGAAVAPPTHADSPELAMRDFSSGQIKKGVRSIGFGGDGATWGNYGLVWKDAGTALVDYGNTSYSNGNDFSFAALGATTPSLWHDLAIYVIAMSERTSAVHFNLHSPGLGQGPIPVTGEGNDDALFSKVALPLGHGVSAGVLLSYETSHFDANSIAVPADAIRYQTQWRPSGGFGVAWQPSKQLLFGFRALLNNDLEQRIDPSGISEGLARSYEYRLGGSASPWEGALLDLGGTRLEKRNAVSRTHTIANEPNIGFEQAFINRHFVVRLGVDETSPTAGFSVKFAPFTVDVAYVRNMARARVGELFGSRSDSFVATFVLDYEALRRGH